MIKPTVGRVVWFWHGGTTNNGHTQPCAAIVTYVHSDAMVNLAVFDQNGFCSPRTSVPLRQDNDERPNGMFCEWMPYQKGQAAKTEALEQRLSAAEMQTLPIR